MTIVAAASLLVSALDWTLIGSLLTQIGDQQGDVALHDPEFSWVANGHQMLSLALVCGLAFLFSMLGLSGWVRSRSLGVFSTAVSAGAALVVWQILRHLIN